MEFKKTNRSGKERPKLTGSHPHDHTLAYPRSTPRSAPSLSTTPLQHVASVRPIPQSSPSKRSLKTVIISYIEQSLNDRKTIIILTILVASLLITGALIAQHNLTKNSDDTKTSRQKVESLEYQTILPEGKSISDFGGWTRVSPPKTDPVYAYTDEINSTSINVSEQPLPQS